MKIRYYYKNKKGDIKQNELTIEQVENGDKKKFENGIPLDFKVYFRLPIFNMDI